MLCMTLAVKAQVTLAWNPTPGVVTNYTVFWGTNSGVYVFSATAGTLTTLQVTGLTPGMVYYFTVEATASDGSESPYSDEVTYTNSSGSTLTSGTTDTNGTPGLPGLPGLPGTNSSTGNTGATASSGSTSTGSTGPTGATAVSTTTSEFPIQGVPPFMRLGLTNGTHPLLAISGTVGATLMVQSTTNVLNPDSWATITNLSISVADPNVQSNGGAPSALTTAFVPAAQGYEVIDTNPPSGEFYRVVMPYDYMVLADAVLSGAGFPSRLLLIRMPGVANDNVCFVTPQSSFLFYDKPNQAFVVEPSGSTIRQIATTFSGSLGQNWTSASEFAYSNGLSTILATVVKTEPPSSDPVAGPSVRASKLTSKTGFYRLMGEGLRFLNKERE